MLIITFLGTGSGVPTKRRNHPAIVFEYFSKRKDTFLFDCGEGTQLQFIKAGISYMEVSKIFITHWHADHFAGLLPMLQTMNLEKRKKPLLIFAPKATEFVKKIMSLYIRPITFRVLSVDVDITENPTKIFETREYEIFAIKAIHTTESVSYIFKEKDKWSIDVKKLKEMGLRRGKWLETLKIRGEYEIDGKKIKIEDVATKKIGLKVVYSGDTSYNENLVKAAKNADVLIHDSTFIEKDKESDVFHSSALDAAKVAKKANVKLLVLFHISRRYHNKEEEKKLLEEAKSIFPRVVLAKDFMKIQLKTQQEPIINYEKS